MLPLAGVCRRKLCLQSHDDPRQYYWVLQVVSRFCKWMALENHILSHTVTEIRRNQSKWNLYMQVNHPIALLDVVRQNDSKMDNGPDIGPNFFRTVVDGRNSVKSNQAPIKKYPFFYLSSNYINLTGAVIFYEISHIPIFANILYYRYFSKTSCQKLLKINC